LTVANSRTANIHELRQVFEVLRHFGRQNHVNDILS